MRGPHIMKCILGLSMAIATNCPATSQAPASLPTPERIVLFGAHWCAPCQAEYRSLPDLVAASAPDKIVLAWVDRPVQRPSMVSKYGVEELATKDAQALGLRLGGEGYGLPFTAVMDGDGRLCALWRKPLHPEDVMRLISSCHR